MFYKKMVNKYRFIKTINRVIFTTITTNTLYKLKLEFGTRKPFLNYYRLKNYLYKGLL